MTARGIAAAFIVVALVWIVGCGGGGGTSTPGGGNVGTAAGKVNISGTPAGSCHLLLDGVSVPVPIQPDGSFEIPNVPPGDHVVSVIGPDGMTGGRASFHQDAGAREVVPPITTEMGGKIVGTVTKLDNGVLTPLADVEVQARSDMMEIMNGAGATTIAPSGVSTPMPLIYPPPDNVTYSAHTDADGFFVMSAVTPGSYFVTVAVAGLTAGEGFAWVTAGHTAVSDFSLEPVIQAGVGQLVGTVLSVSADGTKAPLEGAVIEVNMNDGWQPPTPGPIVVPPGVALPGSSIGNGPVSGGSGGSTDGGSGSSGGGIAVSPPDIIWKVFSTLTDRDGKYSLNLPSGHGQVSAWAYGYMQDSRAITIQPDQTATADFELAAGPVAIPLPATRPAQASAKAR